MVHRPKRSKVPPQKVYVIFEAETMHPLAVMPTEPKELFEGELVYRYDKHERRKRG